MAIQWKVAWVTVKRAVDELVDEGWLESRHGVGTFVRVRKSAAEITLTASRQYQEYPFLNVENLEAFHAFHPNVRIVLSSEPVTDIVVSDSYALVVDRLRGQQLLSLDDLLKRFRREPWSLPASMRAMGSYGGELYGLPIQAVLLLLQTNPALIESVGAKPAERQLTWEQYLDILRRCRRDLDGDGFPECYGAFSRLTLYEWLVPFWQRGGRLDNREAFFGTDAFAVLDEVWRLHHVSRTLPIDMPTTHGETTGKVIQQRFLGKRIAMRWIASPWLFRRVPFPSSVVLPQFGPVARQQAHATLMGIHRESQHPDVALEFLDFCYQRFIHKNAEYPFAVAETDRRLLRQMPAVHRLLQEGMSNASEPLHEGMPERTWAIEREILNWFRLLQDRETAVARMRAHWEQSSGSADEFLIVPDHDVTMPMAPMLSGA